MGRYVCHVCKGLCDAGEIENGVCFECRKEASEAEERRQMQIRKDINLEIRRKMKERYGIQPDGQMVMHYGTN